VTVNSHAHAALNDLHKLRDTGKIKQSCASVETKHKKQNYNGSTSCNLCDLAIYMSTVFISQNSKQPINHSYHCILNNVYPVSNISYKLCAWLLFLRTQCNDTWVLSYLARKNHTKLVRAYTLSLTHKNVIEMIQWMGCYVQLEKVYACCMQNCQLQVRSFRLCIDKESLTNTLCQRMWYTVVFLLQTQFNFFKNNITNILSTKDCYSLCCCYSAIKPNECILWLL
jgi:hypothetical protein